VSRRERNAWVGNNTNQEGEKHTTLGPWLDLKRKRSGNLCLWKIPRRSHRGLNTKGFHRIIIGGPKTEAKQKTWGRQARINGTKHRFAGTNFFALRKGGSGDRLNSPWESGNGGWPKNDGKGLLGLESFSPGQRRKNVLELGRCVSRS